MLRQYLNWLEFKKYLNAHNMENIQSRSIDDIDATLSVFVENMKQGMIFVNVERLISEKI